MWSVGIGLSLLVTVYNHRSEVRTLAENEARANLDKDLALRLWATSHGGVYVPVDENTPPNPYLAVAERDITTPNGVALTLMNPAYMLRQTITFFGELYGIKGHITSQHLLNPANAPDDWELAALKSFDQGERVASEIVDMDGEPHFRLMRAMIMERGCIKCHLSSGVKVGEVRGGIGVAVPLKPLYSLMRDRIITDSIIHGVLWLGGLGGISVAGRRLSRLAGQRDEALDEVAASEDRYRRIVETAQEGVWLLDCNGVTIYANAVMARLAGLPPEEMAGRPAADFLDNEALPHLLDCDSKVPARLESSLASRLHGPVDVIINATPLSSQEADERILCMVTDISGLRRGEQRLLDLVDKLSKSNAELERFAQVAAHDLQEPLRSIVSFAQLLDRNHKGALNGEAREYIDFMVAGARRMHLLVNDLLVYSRFSADAGRFQPFDSHAAASLAVANLNQMVEESAAEVVLGPMPEAQGDPAQVVQVFANLVSNALKFRAPGQPPRIRIEGVRKGGEVEFSVTDNGIGIEPEYFDEIFRVFRRLHPAATFDGTGMGLAICKRIVDRHGGRIWVESQPGQGSTFRFTLPAG